MSVPQRRRRAVSTAREWIGTPYRHQASVPHVGMDCLGLVRALWRSIEGREPEPTPNYASVWAESGTCERLEDAARRHFTPARVADIRPGDVLLFRMRPGALVKHCGLATGQETFIHAYQGAGTVETRLAGAWLRRLAGAVRFPSLADQESV